jgi:calcineurin-like phosphoesterase family protein
MKFENQNIFFASDYHLGHHNVIKYDNRPFRNVDEMHSVLLRNWNSVVGINDIVFYLGDLSFGKSELSKWFTHSINGKIHFILGNHDKMKDIVKLNRFESIHPYGCEIWIKDKETKSARGSDGYQQIVLSHYPILSWNRSHHGSWHIHGHSHQSITKSDIGKEYYKRKVIDIGCNGWNYTPQSYQQIKEVMNNKKGSESRIDHHQ